MRYTSRDEEHRDRQCNLMAACAPHVVDFCRDIFKAHKKRKIVQRFRRRFLHARTFSGAHDALTLYHRDTTRAEQS